MSTGDHPTWSPCCLRTGGTCPPRTPATDTRHDHDNPEDLAMTNELSRLNSLRHGGLIVVMLVGGATALAQNGLPLRFKPPTGSVLFGEFLASGGDADNDGFDEVLIMDADYEEGGVVLGRSFMYSGRTHRELWHATGSQALDFSGGSRYLVGAFIGDIDGDGGDDVALGQPSAERNRGRVDVYSGRTGALRYSLVGAADDGRFGRDVARIGDVDRDGRPDFAVVARYASDGRVALYSGRDGSEILSLERSWPRRVRCAGDLDGDNRPEIAVGAWNSIDGGLGITVFSSSDGSIMSDLGRPFPEDNFFGWNLDGGYDLTGDDIPDLVASGREYYGSRAYVVDGRTGDVTPLIPPSEYPEGKLFGFGIQLADVNGDGRVEAAVAGLFTQVVFDTRTGATLTWSRAGRIGRNGVFGNELAMGDVNGDGSADFITTDIIETGGAVARAGAPILLRSDSPYFRRHPYLLTLTAYLGSPDRTIYFLASRNDSACTYIPRFDLCLNLAPPFVLLGHAVTDAEGFAILHLDAASPPASSGWLQAIDPGDPQRGAIASNLLQIGSFW